jgi:hypothetical protein
MTVSLTAALSPRARGRGMRSALRATFTVTGWRLNYELLWEDNSDEAVRWVQEEFDALWHSPFAVPNRTKRYARLPFTLPMGSRKIGVTVP